MVEYRPIDINVDSPQDGDEFYSELDHVWKDRNKVNVIRNERFSRDTQYRRPIVTNSVKNFTPVKKEEVMSEAIKFETAKKVVSSVGRFTGRMVWKAMNYWAFEPVKEVATKTMRAVRYVTLGTAVMGGIYAYNDPQGAKDLLWKCVPKVSVSFEAPEILG